MTGGTAMGNAEQGWARPLASVALLACLAVAAAEDLPPPPLPDTQSAPRAAPAGTLKDTCIHCGVVRSIRTLERERGAQRDVPSYMTSSQYLDTRRYSQPYVGPVVGMTFGPGESTKSFVGAAGSPSMRQRILDITYEVTVRYDDGRYGLIEQSDVDRLRVGERVQVIDNRVEPAPKNE